MLWLFCMHCLSVIIALCMAWIRTDYAGSLRIQKYKLFTRWFAVLADPRGSASLKKRKGLHFQVLFSYVRVRRCSFLQPSCAEKQYCLRGDKAIRRGPIVLRGSMRVVDVRGNLRLCDQPVALRPSEAPCVGSLFQHRLVCVLTVPFENKPVRSEVPVIALTGPVVQTAEPSSC